MDFVSEKLNSFTGNALSSINEITRKKQQQQTDQPQVVEGAVAGKSSAIPYDLQGPRQRPTQASKLQSTPFGGDTFFGNQSLEPPPPPIGFRLNPPQSPDCDNDNKNLSQAQPSSNLGENQRQNGSSDASLYAGDAWARLWFQRVMILTFIRLLLFIRKVYEDFVATKTYRVSDHTGHFFVSAATLFLPTAVFTIYRVSRYLQIALPATRGSNSAPYPAIQSCTSQRSTKRKDLDAKNEETSTKRVGTNDEDESQLRRALMSSPQNDDDGLVTARQSPSNLDEFHDSKSHQATVVARTDGATSPAPSTTLVKDSPTQEKYDESIVIKESVDMDKLGNLPDKENARIVIGASEQLLHGVLFVFWQLKRQVDVMGYLVERSCLWRKPRDDEKEQLDKLRISSDGLEWFQDFYAAFLAILAQVYTLGLHWTSSDNTKESLPKGPLAGSAANYPASSEQPIDHLKNLNQSNTLLSSLHGTDLLIMSELVVSSAVVFSLLVAVRRRDDGLLTLGLSMLGWGSIFASRIIVIASAFAYIGWRIMLPLVGCHILGATGWIYKIAIDSHNGKADESEESKWQAQPDEVNPSVVLNSSGLSSGSSATDKQKDDKLSSTMTSQWTVLEHLALLSQIFTLFALPSLFYWPIMFNLKLHYRPFKYLALILAENTILIAAIWFKISSIATSGQWYLLGAAGGFSITGFVFISLYISCKPSLTEYFARADELFNEADKSGVYFEFCSRVFKMPDLSKHAFRRLMNQTEEIQEIEVIDV